MGFVVILNSLVLIVLFFKVLSKEDNTPEMDEITLLQESNERIMELIKRLERGYASLSLDLDRFETTELRAIQHDYLQRLERSRKYCFKLRKDIDKLKEGKNV